MNTFKIILSVALLGVSSMGAFAEECAGACGHLLCHGCVQPCAEGCGHLLCHGCGMLFQACGHGCGMLCQAGQSGHAHSCNLDCGPFDFFAWNCTLDCTGPMCSAPPHRPPVEKYELTFSEPPESYESNLQREN